MRLLIRILQRVAIFAIGVYPKIIFGATDGAVVNLIPPQKAGLIAHKAGVVGEDKKWCPVNQVTFESTIAKDVHIIGDASSAGAMPKSGYSANSQAKVCALNIVQLMNDKDLIDPSHVNVCYSYLTDKEAVTVSAVYKVAEGKTIAVAGFSYADGRVSTDGNVVAERVTTELIKTKKLKVVERKEIQKVLGELRLQSAGAIDQASAKKIGSMLGADLIVIGTLAELPGNKLELNVRMAGVESGEAISAVSGHVVKDWIN